MIGSDQAYFKAGTAGVTSGPVAVDQVPASAGARLAGAAGAGVGAAGAGALVAGAIAPVAAFPVGGVVDLRRTQALRLAEIEWLARPYAADRYLPDSRITRVLGCQVEIIRDPERSLRDILPAVYLDLNNLIYQGNRARPGTFMHLHMAQASTLAVARRGQEVVGFSLATHLEIGGRPIVLHNATAISPTLRGHSLTLLLNAVHLLDAFKRARGGEFYSAARTYNPLVFGALLSTGPYYPDPGRRPPDDIRQVARAIAHHLNPHATFDDNLMIQRAAWKNVLAGATPRHRRPDVNTYCDLHLRTGEGDGLVVVGKFTPATMAKLVWRSAWKQITPRLNRS